MAHERRRNRFVFHLGLRERLRLCKKIFNDFAQPHWGSGCFLGKVIFLQRLTILTSVLKMSMLQWRMVFSQVQYLGSMEIYIESSSYMYVEVYF